MNDVPGGTSTPPAPGEQQQKGLEPGAGAPIVAGPPHSVRGPMSSPRLNAGIGLAGILYLLAIVAAVVLVILLIVHLVHR